MKSVFILGASRLQIPAIKKAKEKGMYVYVLDYDPHAVGIQFADRYLEISTIDKEAVYRAAVQYSPDFIITSTSDMPVRTVSWVCEKLGMASGISYDGAVCATDKVAMRKRMRECGVPIPDFYEIKNREDFLKTVRKMPDKFILKPSDNAASRGVVLVDKNKEPDYDKLYEYALQYSRCGTLLVEEYLQGPEVSVESYTICGEPHLITITDKMVSEEPFFVEIGHTEPSRLTTAQWEDIGRVADAAIRAIGMVNGPTHTEIRVTEEGAKLIEIAARAGGDYITSHLVPLSTGVDMTECMFASLLGYNVPYVRLIDRGAAIRFLQGRNGILKAVEGVEFAKKMPGVQEVIIYSEIGDRIKYPENSSDRIGHVIATGRDAEEAAQNAEAAESQIHIIVG